MEGIPKQPGLTILLAGYPDPRLSGEIAAGRHPRVEFLEAVAKRKARVLSFADLRYQGSSPRRHWLLALLAQRSTQRGDKFLATGEDIGFRMALLQRASLGRTPLAILTHGSYFRSEKTRWVMRILQGMKDVHFLCLSESLRQRVNEDYGIPGARVTNVGYGVDTHYFQPQDRPASRLVAAAGLANRDYETLVRATAGQDVEVRIAADSAWFGGKVSTEGMRPAANILLRSYGDYAGLRELYADAALVVVPLRPAQHACGYAVMVEAMAMGKPVIATRTAAPGDYIREGQTGFYVSPGDPKELWKRIARLLEDSDLRQRIGQQARERVATHFSLEAYTGRLLSALDALTPMSPGRARPHLELAGREIGR